MRARRLTALDPLAAGGAALTALMLVLYVAVVRSQGNRPASWVLVLLAVALALSAYGVPNSRRSRRPVLLLAAGLLGALGLLAILTIGLGILAAATLCLLAALRSAPRLPEPTGTPR